jgi:hypothetical protein
LCIIGIYSDKCPHSIMIAKSAVNRQVAWHVLLTQKAYGGG